MPDGGCDTMTRPVAVGLPKDTASITAEWLTKVLQQDYPGTVVTSLYLGTIIPGTATKVRLLLSYNEAGHAHGLPPTMWLKGGFIRHDFTFDESFVWEAKFFKNWAPSIEINIPKAFWADWDEGEQGLVLLEDLAARNVSFGLATKPMTLDQQAGALDILACLHARWWNSPQLAPLRSFSTVWDAADRVVMMMLEKDYFDRCMAMDRCKEITGPYRDRERVKAGLRMQWKRSLEIAQCFSHGDPHLGNMYFETDGTPGFLDWQGWQSGPYMHDVAYSIIGGLDVAERRLHERDLLEHYRQRLVANGVKDAPPADEVWEAYRRHAMHGFMWAFTPTEMQPEEICVAEGHRFGVAVRDLDTFGALGV